MHRVVDLEVQRQLDVAQGPAHRWHADAEGHGQRRGNGVDTAADAAHPAGDEHGVARVTALEDDFVAAKERADRVGLQDLAGLEVDDGVERQRTGHPGDRIEVDVLDVAVAGQELLHLRSIEVTGLVGVAVEALFQPGVALGVELHR